MSLLLFFVVPIVGCPALVFYLRSRRAVTSGDQGVAIRSERTILYLIAFGGVILGLGLFVGCLVILAEKDIQTAARDSQLNTTQDEQHLPSTTINLAASLDYMKSLLARDNDRKVLCMSNYEKLAVKYKEGDNNLEQAFLLRNQLQIDPEC